MKILFYLLVPVLAVAGYAIFVWARNRQPSSLESGVDAFRREMDALSPEGAPQYRRRPDPGTGMPPPSRPSGGSGGTGSAGASGGSAGGSGGRPSDGRPPRRPPTSDRHD